MLVSRAGRGEKAGPAGRAELEEIGGAGAEAELDDDFSVQWADRHEVAGHDGETKLDVGPEDDD